MKVWGFGDVMVGPGIAGYWGYGVGAQQNRRSTVSSAGHCTGSGSGP